MIFPVILIFVNELNRNIKAKMWPLRLQRETYVPEILLVKSIGKHPW